MRGRTWQANQQTTTGTWQNWRAREPEDSTRLAATRRQSFTAVAVRAMRRARTGHGAVGDGRRAAGPFGGRRLARRHLCRQSQLNHLVEHFPIRALVAVACDRQHNACSRTRQASKEPKKHKNKKREPSTVPLIGGEKTHCALICCDTSPMMT